MSMVVEDAVELVMLAYPLLVTTLKGPGVDELLEL